MAATKFYDFSRQLRFHDRRGMGKTPAERGRPYPCFAGTQKRLGANARACRHLRPRRTHGI